MDARSGPRRLAAQASSASRGYSGILPARCAGGPSDFRQNHFAMVEAWTGIPWTSVKYLAASARRSLGGQFEMSGGMLNCGSIETPGNSECSLKMERHSGSIQRCKARYHHDFW